MTAHALGLATIILTQLGVVLADPQTPWPQKLIAALGTVAATIFADTKTKTATWNIIIACAGFTAPVLTYVLGTMQSGTLAANLVTVAIGVAVRLAALKNAANAIPPAAVVLLLLGGLTLGSCASLQRNQNQIVCAAIQTVKNAPALMQEVQGCANNHATAADVLSCLSALAATGSTWTRDEVACFAATAAGIESCPAVPTVAEDVTGGLRVSVPGPSLQWRASPAALKLRQAVEASGWRFAGVAP